MKHQVSPLPSTACQRVSSQNPRATAIGSLSPTRAVTQGHSTIALTLSALFGKNEQIDSRSVEGTDKELFQKMIEQYGEDSTVARVEVMGEFPKADDDTVIPMDLIKSAIDRDVALAANEPIVWGLDVARYGGDNPRFVSDKETM